MSDEKIVRLDPSRKKKPQSGQELPTLGIDTNNTRISTPLTAEEIRNFIKVIQYIASFSTSSIAELQIIEQELLVKIKNYAEYEAYAGFEAGACLEMLASITLTDDDSIVETFVLMLDSLIPDK